jgi:glycosyltransferase involved in cell wall biosynthesis
MFTSKRWPDAGLFQVLRVDGILVMKKADKSGADERIRMITFIDDLCAGGTQKWLIHILKGLQKLGYDHKVFVVRNIINPHFLQEVRKYAEVEIIGEPAFWSIYGFIHVYRSIKQWQPDIVQTLLPSSDVIGRVLAWLAAVPVIVSSIRGHNLDKSRWLLWLDNCTAGLAERVIFNAEDAIPFALAHEGVVREQVVYIPNGVEQLNPTKSPSEIRRELGIPEEARIIGAVGRLHPSKGHDNLIGVFAKLAEEIPALFLLIVGDGELSSTLKKQVTDRRLDEHVLFTGYRTDIPDLLAIMEVFAHPSLWEGMPNALMEAMANGKPVVASGIDGIKALIVDGMTGLLVRPDSTDELFSQLHRLMTDRELAAKLGQHAAQSMKEQFSLERMVKSYDEVYKTLLHEKGAFQSQNNNDYA